MKISADASIEKFLESLSKETVAKSLRTIRLLEKFDRNLGMPHVKKISGKLFELRISGKQKVRILFIFYKSEIILIHGFIKKSKKIPQKEIKMAFKKIKLLDTI